MFIFEKILEKFGFEKVICNENKEKKKLSQTQNFIFSQNDWFWKKREPFDFGKNFIKKIKGNYHNCKISLNKYDCFWKKKYEKHKEKRKVKNILKRSRLEILV